MKTYLGLDFGGTKLLIGEVDEKGNILREKCYQTGCRKEVQAIEVLEESIRDYVNTVGFAGEIQGAGIGIIGTVDYKHGQWITMHPKTMIQPVPIADILKNIIHVPVWADNDVKSATTAEMVFGSGRKFENFIYLNVGTGLAAGFVVDGRILRGKNNNSGEIGHTVVDISNRDRCICDRHGCIENVVSGYGFTRQAQLNGLSELITEKSDMADTQKLFARALQGEMVPDRILDYAADSLACLIMNLVKTFDPEAFILGGGCVRDGVLMKRAQEHMAECIMESVTGGLILSELDPAYTGLLGAAALPMVAMNQ